MYNLIEYCTAFSKTSTSLRQYYRDEGTKDTNDSVIDFPADNNNSDLFKFKQHITEKNKKRWHKKLWNNGCIKISK